MIEPISSGFYKLYKISVTVFDDRADQFRILSTSSDFREKALMIEPISSGFINLIRFSIKSLMIEPISSGCYKLHQNSDKVFDDRADQHRIL
jgi:hypothetical protein